MEYELIKAIVHGLNKKALEAHDPIWAMQYSQAAVNAANAYATLAAIRKGV